MHCLAVLTELQRLSRRHGGSEDDEMPKITYGGVGVDEQDLCNASSAGDPQRIAAAVAAARAAGRVVLVLGNSNCVENEAADRIPDRDGVEDQNSVHYQPDSGSSGPRFLPTGTSLPGNQEKLALAILALKIPTVLVLISGEGIAIDPLLSADAILYHAYPGGTGGTAIAESILGLHNRFGRLPMSWLPKSWESSVAFSDFAFASLGRSYRYKHLRSAGGQQPDLFAFGSGLSFSGTASLCSPLPSRRYVSTDVARVRAQITTSR